MFVDSLFLFGGRILALGMVGSADKLPICIADVKMESLFGNFYQLFYGLLQ